MTARPIGWPSFDPSAAKPWAVHVPPGCAHGFLALEDDSMLQYVMGERYVTDLARAARWRDPVFAIDWPFQPSARNARDLGYPDWRDV